LCFSSLTESPKLPENYLPLPIVRQSTSYSCGAASLLSILLYWQIEDIPESELFKSLNTTEEGTHPKNIVEYANSRGLKAHMKENTTIEELQLALSKGETVILDIQAWCDTDIDWKNSWENGHYVVLIGLDKMNAFFMDPSIGSAYGYIPIDELMERWHDYEKHEKGVWKNYKLAIFISGKSEIKKYPEKPKKIL